MSVLEPHARWAAAARGARSITDAGPSTWCRAQRPRAHRHPAPRMQGMAPRTLRRRMLPPHRPARARGASSSRLTAPRACTALLLAPPLAARSPHAGGAAPSPCPRPGVLCALQVAPQPPCGRAVASSPLHSHHVPVEVPMRPPERGALPRRGRARRTGSAGRPRSGGRGPPSPCLRSARWRAHRVASPPHCACVQLACAGGAHDNKAGTPSLTPTAPCPARTTAAAGFLEARATLGGFFFFFFKHAAATIRQGRARASAHLLPARQSRQALAAERADGPRARTDGALEHQLLLLLRARRPAASAPWRAPPLQPSPTRGTAHMQRPGPPRPAHCRHSRRACCGGGAGPALRARVSGRRWQDGEPPRQEAAQGAALPGAGGRV